LLKLGKKWVKRKQSVGPKADDKYNTNHVLIKK